MNQSRNKNKNQNQNQYIVVSTHCKSSVAITRSKTSTNPPTGTFHVAMSSVLRIWDVTERSPHRTLPNRAIAAFPSYGTFASAVGPAVSISGAFIRALAETGVWDRCEYSEEDPDDFHF